MTNPNRHNKDVGKTDGFPIVSVFSPRGTLLTDESLVFGNSLRQPSETNIRVQTRFKGFRNVF